jgi:predicted AlkP superfamily phosphohydrolase/phosphomutase
MTYPPRPVNGIVVGCFLAPSLDKAVYPPEVLGKLNALGYRIDIDPVAARESVENLRQEVPEVLDGRIRTLLSFIEREAWDLLVCHVMETDRVMHFLWRYYEEGRGENHDFFLSFYRRLDEGIGKAVAAVGDDTEIMVLSDHGFCGIKAEVQLNRWLAREGFLTLAGDPADGFAAVCPASKAVALVPGRIHILRP